MKITNSAQIRNFVVAGHNGCGKTTLCDLMLFKAGAVDRLGSVDYCAHLFFERMYDILGIIDSTADGICIFSQIREIL